MVMDYSVIASVVGILCFFIFGYDIGVSGGVTGANAFLEKFFPSIYRNRQSLPSWKENKYCILDDQLLILFTSSLYLSGLIASLVAPWVSRAIGRKPSMILAASVFLIGSIINGAAENVWMLIGGRMFHGIGVGFVIQVAPMYVSDIALPNIFLYSAKSFVNSIMIGIVWGTTWSWAFNYMMKDVKGWRISLAIPAVPAFIAIVGILFLPETPNSLIERGHEEEALAILKRIRGVEDVSEELSDLIRVSNASKHPWKIVTRKYRLQFAISLLIPFFQHLTFINVVILYAPVLVETLIETLGFGNGNNDSVFATIHTVIVMPLMQIILVDLDHNGWSGRRFKYLVGGALMIISQIAIGVDLKFGFSGQASQSIVYKIIPAVLMCIHTTGFTWSWGLPGWLVKRDIFPLEIQSAGVTMNASVNLFMAFVIAHAFLPALCHLKFFLFFIFAGVLAISTLLIYFFVPETKDIPIEQVSNFWKEHWYWSRFFSNEEGQTA